MITVKDIVYSVGGRLILDKVSFTLANNEKIGLVGINGVGKSTLFEIILGKKHYDSGEISFSNSSTSVGYMSQTLKLDEILFDQKVFDYLLSARPVEEIKFKIEEIIEKLSLCKSEEESRNLLEELSFFQERFEFFGGYSAEDELMRIIDGLSLDGIDLDMKVGALSGGQKSKVNFVRVLYSKPDMLLLDEPTNHLDKKSKAWLISYISKYQGIVLVISHDKDFLNSTVSKIVMLNENTRRAEIFSGNYSHYLTVWQERLEANNRLAKNQDREINRLQDYVDSMKGVSGKRKRQANSKGKALVKMIENKVSEAPRIKHNNLHILPKAESPATPLHIVDVHFGYKKECEIISGASFLLSKNERFVVVGKNGAGKSTLLKLIVDKLNPWKGEISISKSVTLGYYAQEHEDLNMKKTVLENAASVSDFNQSKLRGVLGKFMFSGEKVFQKVETLSPGEKSRLALAKISLRGPNLLVLDEPTNHLDRETSKIIANALRDYGGAVIVVSHDVEFLEKLGVERMLILPSCRVKYYDRSIVEKFYLES